MKVDQTMQVLLWMEPMNQPVKGSLGFSYYVVVLGGLFSMLPVLVPSQMFGHTLHLCSLNSSERRLK